METTTRTTAALSSDATDAQRSTILALGSEILTRESEAIQTARNNLSDAFVQAVRMILSCTGRVAVTGMGKAGLVGRKIQATLASTGAPAYSLHPAEAIHGDLGMICPDDLILALSNSGETQELVRLLPVFKSRGCSVILMTGRPRSQCAAQSDVVIDIGDVPEACPLRLAPSSSTTAMLAMGDALALTVMKLRGVRPEQYAAFHPGGALGRSLMKVHEIMRTGPDCPFVGPGDTINEYYEAVQKAPRRAGAAAVVDAEGKLVGFFTDGDLRRCFLGERHPRTVRIEDVMTRDPKYARSDDLVANAIRPMQRFKIDELPVVDDGRRLVGLIDIQDLMACGFSTFDDQ